MTESGKVEAYAQAILEIARAEDRISPVEDDLFRFARALEGSDELRVALTDPALPVERRLAVVEQLTGGKILPLSTALIGLVIAAGQVNDFSAIADAQIDRLAAALGRATGKTIEVKVIIDPTVLGGVVAQIGDTVIDGTVRHRLEQMKAQL